MELCIIDASVAVKWFTEEAFKAQAISLFDRLQRHELKIVVPELFYVEVASVFWQQVRAKKLTYGEASKIVDQLMELPLKRYSDHELADVSFENAAQYGISVYDAVYLSLAEVYVAPLVTADEVLLKACRNRFDFIVPLHSYGTRVE